MNNKTKLFVAVVDKSWYEGFIPFYIYFCNRACPDADILIYFRGELEQNTKDIMNLLGCYNYKVIENWRTEYDDSPFVTKTLRWLINDSLIKEYEYVYIGDIDILINLESPDLFEQHKKHSDFLCLPFSNIVRPQSDMFPNINKMSGLHFIKTKEYFLGTDSLINMYLLDEHLLNQFREENESVLYAIIKQTGWIEQLSKIEDTEENKKLFRPTHGVHVGCFRYTYRYRLNEDFYFKDFIQTFMKNITLLKALKMSNLMVQSCLKKALLYSKKVL